MVGPSSVDDRGVVGTPVAELSVVDREAPVVVGAAEGSSPVVVWTGEVVSAVVVWAGDGASPVVVWTSEVVRALVVGWGAESSPDGNGVVLRPHAEAGAARPGP